LITLSGLRAGRLVGSSPQWQALEPTGALQADESQASSARLREETGSILPLVAFYSFLCIVLVFLVSAVTSLYLERERLYSVADAAALAGAEAYDLAAVRVVEGHPRPVLESSSVRSAVSDFLAAPVAAGIEGLEVEQAMSSDGRSATVRLSAIWRPPVVSMLVPAGLRIRVTSTARSVFW
jgi:hypothetical protein